MTKVNLKPERAARTLMEGILGRYIGQRDDSHPREVEAGWSEMKSHYAEWCTISNL